MSKDIYIETGEISARLLVNAQRKLQAASGKLNDISYYPTYRTAAGHVNIYPDALISEIVRLRRAVDAALEKTQQYADILGKAPERIVKVDSLRKGEVTSWKERAAYRYDSSIFGKVTDAIGNVAVDVYHDTVSGIKGTYDFVVDGLEYGVKTVRGKINQIASDLVQSYEDHGIVYDVVEYGKCVVKGVVGIAEIVGGAVEIATGAGIPMGIIHIISGMNKINNVAADLTYLNCDAYELVGTTNWLEDLLVENGGEIGAYFGNEEAGETAGQIVYTGFELVSLLDGADELLKNLGKVNTLTTGSTGYSFCWGWTDFDDILDSSTGKIVWDTLKGGKDVLEDAWEFGEKLIKLR